MKSEVTDSSVAVIDEMLQYTEAVRNGEMEVRPGMPAAFTRGCTAGDAIWQGDLGLIVIDDVPEGYTLVQGLKEEHRQLVPGNTQGSKHCLNTVAGVKMWRRDDFGQENVLTGPVFVCTEDIVVEHPTHGDVTVPGGMMIKTTYQREWDLLQKAERRAQD